MAIYSIIGYCWLSLAGAMVFGFCEPTLTLVAVGNLHLVVVAAQDCPVQIKVFLWWSNSNHMTINN